jgi:membrane protein DedA with SNARE-associated domain
VTIARFVEGLRQANGIIAGTTGMRWRRFLAFNVLAALGVFIIVLIVRQVVLPHRRRETTSDHGYRRWSP